MSHPLSRPLTGYTSLHNKSRKDIDEVIGLLEKNGFKRVDKPSTNLLSNEYCVTEIKSNLKIKTYNIDWKV